MYGVRSHEGVNVRARKCVLPLFGDCLAGAPSDCFTVENSCREKKILDSTVHKMLFTKAWRRLPVTIPVRAFRVLQRSGRAVHRSQC